MRILKKQAKFLPSLHWRQRSKLWDWCCFSRHPQAYRTCWCRGGSWGWMVGDWGTPVAHITVRGGNGKMQSCSHLRDEVMSTEQLCEWRILPNIQQNQGKTFSGRWMTVLEIQPCKLMQCTWAENPGVVSHWLNSGSPEFIVFSTKT